MKRIFLLFAVAIMSVGIAFAQEFPEAFMKDETLKSIFVNPLGITNAFSDTNPESIENQIKKNGLDYKTLDFGFGQGFVVYPEDFEIEGVKISQVAISVCSGMNMIMYFTESSPLYLDAISYLANALKGCGINPLGPTGTNRGDNYEVYQLSPHAGIAISTDKQNQKAQIFLIDINNLMEFLKKN